MTESECESIGGEIVFAKRTKEQVAPREAPMGSATSIDATGSRENTPPR